MTIVVVGDVMVDVVAAHREPLAHGSDTAASTDLRGGGGGGNVAAWLAHAGADVALVGRVGADALADVALGGLDGVDLRVERATGERPRLFRPPLGFRSPASAWAARQRGHRVIMWSRRAFDGVPVSPERIVERLGPRCGAGDIVTLHDGKDPHGNRTIESTLTAIRPLVRMLRERGLEPERLDEVANVGGV